MSRQLEDLSIACRDYVATSDPAQAMELAAAINEHIGALHSRAALATGVDIDELVYADENDGGSDDPDEVDQSGNDPYSAFDTFLVMRLQDKSGATDDRRLDLIARLAESTLVPVYESHGIDVGIVAASYEELPPGLFP